MSTSRDSHKVVNVTDMHTWKTHTITELRICILISKHTVTSGFDGRLLQLLYSHLTSLGCNFVLSPPDGAKPDPFLGKK